MHKGRPSWVLEHLGLLPPRGEEQKDWPHLPSPPPLSFPSSWLAGTLPCLAAKMLPAEDAPIGLLLEVTSWDGAVDWLGWERIRPARVFHLAKKREDACRRNWCGWGSQPHVSERELGNRRQIARDVCVFFHTLLQFTTKGRDFPVCDAPAFEIQED